MNRRSLLSTAAVAPLALLAACHGATGSFDLKAAIADARLIVGDAGSGLLGIVGIAGTTGLLRPADAAKAVSDLGIASDMLAALATNPPDVSTARAGVKSVLGLARSAVDVLAKSGAINDTKIVGTLQAVSVLMPIVAAMIDGLVPAMSREGGMTPARARAKLAGAK